MYKCLFTGVNAIKAGRYRKGEIGETEQKGESEDRPEDEGEEDVTKATSEDLFGEGEDPEEEDMFGGGDEQDIFSPAFDNIDSRAGKSWCAIMPALNALSRFAMFIYSLPYEKKKEGIHLINCCFMPYSRVYYLCKGTGQPA